jgi:hypothetical protein
MDGWAAGFRAWFRVFGIAIVLWLPFLLLVGIVLVAIFAPVFVPLIAEGEPGVESFVGMCCGFLIGGLVLLLLGILLGLLDTLAVRHAVLGQVPASFAR